MLCTAPRFVLLVFAVLELGFSAELSAQTELEKLQMQKEKLEIEGMRKQKLAEELETKGVHPLESTVDPETYIIGPGDILTISIWGQVNESHEVNVTPEGYVLIPFVRPQFVADLNLTKAKEAIKRAVLESYNTKEVTTTLTELRKFKVGVSGAVANPGTHVVTAGDRVSDAITAAGGFEELEELLKEELRGELEIEIENYPAKRNITLTHRDGTIERCDIQSYFSTGDKNRNPLMLDGDVVYVPRIGENISVINLFGSLNNPGIFDYAPGDSLLKLITLAGGLSLDADSTRVEIIRFRKDGKSTESLILDLAVGNPARDVNVALRPDDMIFVRSKLDFHKKAFVDIKGEAINPGSYYITENQTTLKEIMERAGGFTPEASLSKAELVRRKSEELVDREYERLSMMTAEEMSEIEYEYFKAKSRQKQGAVSVDFQALFLENDLSEDIVLLGNDLITIPKMNMTVNLIGSIERPGLATYIEGKTVRYYIENAGGFLWNARKGEVRIIRAESTEQIKAKKSDLVYVGDTIFIPERRDRDWWELTMETMTIITQLATIVIVVQSATGK